MQQTHFLYLDGIRRFTVSLRIQSEYEKTRMKKNSAVSIIKHLITFACAKKIYSEIGMYALLYILLTNSL